MIAEARDQCLDEFGGRWIKPVQVLHHNALRMPLRAQQRLLDEHRDGLFAQLIGQEIRPFCCVVGDAGQRSQDRGGSLALSESPSRTASSFAKAAAGGSAASMPVTARKWSLSGRNGLSWSKADAAR